MSESTVTSPGMKRILSALEAEPGLITNDLAVAANIAKKSARTYIRQLEQHGEIHHSHWIADPDFKSMYRRGFSIGPQVGPEPKLPKGARNKGNPGRKERPIVPIESSMPEYATILGALLGKQLPQERKSA
jgi:hypothetical protein